MNLARARAFVGRPSIRSTLTKRVFFASNRGHTARARQSRSSSRVFAKLAATLVYSVLCFLTTRSSIKTCSRAFLGSCHLLITFPRWSIVTPLRSHFFLFGRHCHSFVASVCVFADTCSFWFRSVSSVCRIFSQHPLRQNA